MSDLSLKILFAGTPNFSAKHLLALIKRGYSIIGVLTQPDRPSGRGKKLKYSAVKEVTLQYNLPIFQPENLLEKKIEESIYLLNPDLMIVVAYGLIIPKKILKIPRFGCVNVHASLLPRWRGASPIQYALLSGDKKTGITIIKMNSSIDSGDILSTESCFINPKDTTADLYKKLETLSISTLIKTICKLKYIKPIKQDQNKKTFSKKITKKCARLCWLRSAIYLERCVRAFNPWPTSYFEVENHIAIKVWKAEVLSNLTHNEKPGTILNFNKDGMQVVTLKDILNIIFLQIPNKKIVHVKEIINTYAHWFYPGKILL